MSKITLSFEELNRVLSYINTILSDKSVEDKSKNVIFLVNDNDVTLVGYNQVTFSRTSMQDVETEDIPEASGETDYGWVFQVKSSELGKIVSAYSNLYKTKVEKIDFEENNIKVRITVHEVPLDEENDARLAQDSIFDVENTPIFNKVMNDIRTEFPAENNSIVCGDLLLYVGSLMPLMSNDSANSTASKLNFADDYVFTMSSSASAFFKNRLSDEFKGITLGYSSVSFLKKLCEGTDFISVARNKNYLCIESGNTQAFMRYKPIKINYQAYIQRRSKEKGIVVDRLYLKDVLRRMGSISVDGKMSVESEDFVVVTNDVFQQELPLEKCKPGTTGISFKISIPILSSLILGDDGVLAENLYIYFVKTTRSYILYIQDKTGAWFASTQAAKL